MTPPPRKKRSPAVAPARTSLDNQAAEQAYQLPSQGTPPGPPPQPPRVCPLTARAMGLYAPPITTAAARTPLTAEITEWRPLQSNTMRGIFSVLLPSGMLLHGCSLHVADDGRAWISLPSKVRVSHGEVSTYLGKPVYDKVVEVPDRDRRDALQASILAALADHPDAAAELPAGGDHYG